jgi:hypothetical protein
VRDRRIDHGLKMLSGMPDDRAAANGSQFIPGSPVTNRAEKRQPKVDDKRALRGVGVTGLGKPIERFLDV